MSPHPMTCDAFEARLESFLDGALDAATREQCEQHRQRCAQCAALVADLQALVTAAADLPLPTPSRDLWPAIEARLETPVLTLERGVAPRRSATGLTVTWRRLAAAAAVLVTASAGITWQVTTHGGAPAPLVPAASGSVAIRTTDSVAPAPSAAGDVALPLARPVDAVAGTTRLASATAPAPLAIDTLYGREIAKLRTVAEESLGLLDSSTVAIVRRNLDIIDQAIRESREALAADPASSLLLEQLDRAYERKVDLLRRLATL